MARSPEIRIAEPRSSTWAAGFWSWPTASLRNARPAAADPIEASICRRSIIGESSIGAVYATSGDSGWGRLCPRNPEGLFLLLLPDDREELPGHLGFLVVGIGLDDVLEGLRGEVEAAGAEILAGGVHSAADEEPGELLVGDVELLDLALEAQLAQVDGAGLLHAAEGGHQLLHLGRHVLLAL